MSKPFNLTTDSTWPLSVWSSLSLQVCKSSNLDTKTTKIQQFQCSTNCTSVINFRAENSRQRRDQWSLFISSLVYFPTEVSLEVSPCNLRTSFGLFSHLIEISEAGPVIEHLGIRWLQTMKRSLCMCPLELPCFLPKILLPCECNLSHRGKDVTTAS